jgi:hypothetical protein
MASNKAEGRTLEEAVKALRCRKGPSAGISKRGAYWLAVEPVLIRRFGGDGIGINTPDRTTTLELRHYRDGEVRCLVHEHAYHQNGSRAGAGDCWSPSSAVNSCRTAEEIKAALLGSATITGEPVYGRHWEVNIDELAGLLGLPLSMPAPDEATQPAGEEINA